MQSIANKDEKCQDKFVFDGVKTSRTRSVISRRAGLKRSKKVTSIVSHGHILMFFKSWTHFNSFVSHGHILIVYTKYTHENYTY